MCNDKTHHCRSSIISDHIFDKIVKNHLTLSDGCMIGVSKLLGKISVYDN